MADTLNVIALISGGKDSFFSLLHCLQNGHKVVALANLCPPPISRSPTLDGRGQSTQIQSHGIPTDHSYVESDVQFAETEGTDLNSFMYQTVGHSLIPLYSKALQLPLYRRCITGASIQKSQEYSTLFLDDRSDTEPSLDETEDLVPLLRQVIAVHPEANAVSTGAILSTYQRTRVESIVVRLGLTPLSYLWQYPILPPPPANPALASNGSKHRPDNLTGLLQDIATAKLDARIIKIASAGIPENLLFANVADPHTQSRLLSGLLPFFNDDEIGIRSAVLGEGGEFETITLSGPKEVWKGGRIQVEENKNQTYTEGGVHYMKFGTARIVPHDTTRDVIAKDDAVKADLVPIPALLDPQFELVKTELRLINAQNGENSKDTALTTGQRAHSNPKDVSLLQTSISGKINASHRTQLNQGKDTVSSSLQRGIPFSMCCTITSQTLTINNITAASVLEYLNSIHQPALLSEGSEQTSIHLRPAEAQIRTIHTHLNPVIEHLSRSFLNSSLSTANISCASLVLGSMSDFATVNPIYSQIYPKGLPNPPSRVTVAAPLPAGIQVSLSLVFDLFPQELRRGLHVQGRSYWAPANIGPYSQAIAVPLHIPAAEPATNAGTTEEYENLSSRKPEVVYVAGQIPLISSSMNVHIGTFLESAVLSLQHLWRIGQERKVDIWPWSVAYLAQVTEPELSCRINTAAAAWRTAHLKPSWRSDAEFDDGTGEAADDQTSDEDQDSVVDIWDLQRNRSFYLGFRPSQMSIGKHLHVLPNHRLLYINHFVKERFIPPFLAAEVISLPRGVSIEWWSNGIAGLAKPLTTSRQYQLDWQTRTSSWGSVSCLTLIPDPSRIQCSIKFISYLIKSIHQNPDLPVNLPQILNELNSTSNTSTSRVQLIQGTAFVSSSAIHSGFWSQFVSTTKDSRSTHTLTTQQTASHTGLLGDSVCLVPCYHLQGSPAFRSKIPSRKPEDIQSRLRNDLNNVEELAVAFLLRAETR